jgi:hypothetical protein
MLFNNIYNLDSTCKGLNCGTKIFYADNIFYLTDNKMKCASAKLKDNNQNLFIDDILVNWEFKDCDKKKIKPEQMLKEFVEFAKLNNLFQVELDDDSFLQIPTKYYHSHESEFKYSLIYLFHNPDKPSIYSSKFNLINKHNSKKWYSNLISYLNHEVTKYKHTSQYNLYSKANELLKLMNIQEDISQEREFVIFKSEYKKFDDFIVNALNEFKKSNINDLICDTDIVNFMGNISRTDIENELNKSCNFSNFTKKIGMDNFYINKIDFDNYLQR